MKEVVPHTELLARAQDMAETWVKAGKQKEIPGGKQWLDSLILTINIARTGGSVQEYKDVNAKESLELADAFLSYNFLNVTKYFVDVYIILFICFNLFRLNMSF